MTLFLVEITILLALGAAVAALLRAHSAATRHVVWSLTLFAALFFAIATFVAPKYTLAIPDWRKQETVVTTPVATSVATGAPARRATAEAAVATQRPQPTRNITPTTVWLLGFALVLCWRVLGLLGLARIARSATPATWHRLIDDAHATSGVTRPVRIALSESVSAPMTWGWADPIIVLPAGADAWPEERRRAALLHELAHVARNDYLVQLLAGFACALYWFHPAAWLALRRLRRESEQASDDRVLARGIVAPEYATHLLDVARAARTHRPALLALGMACPSHLETRVRALLDETRPRRGMSRRAIAIVVAIVALILVPLAGARPELRARAQTKASNAIALPPRFPRAVTRPIERMAHRIETIAGRLDRSDGEEIVSKSTRTLAASPGETLVLDLETGGSVELRGWDEPRVSIDVVLGGRDGKDTRTDIQRTADGVRVQATFDGSRKSFSSSNHFSIRVPRRFNMRLDSAGGAVAIEDVEGTFAGSTGGGGLRLQRVRGRADLSTGGGEIDVDDVDLDGQVSTGGGRVTLRRVRGGLQGTSGSGPVVRDDVDVMNRVSNIDRDGDTVTTYVDDDGRGHVKSGGLHIEKDGGDVDIDEAPNGISISTGGGEVSVGRSAGMVDARTGGGAITLGPIAGSAYASTGAGDIEITLTDAGGATQTVEVFTGKGDVTLILPPTINARFDIETAYTRSYAPTHIDSVFELDHKPATDWDASVGTPRKFVRATGMAGSGKGLIRVKAVNGDVKIRRGR